MPSGGPAGLGEAPTWWAQASLLVWTDLQARRLHLFDPVKELDRSVETGVMVTRVLFPPGEPLAVTPEGLCYIDPPSGSLRPLASVDDLPPGSRLNDAALDAAGRIWVGTIGAQGRSGDGRLYRFDRAGGWTLVASGFDACNGVAFSPDGRTLYLTETRRRCLLAYDFDVATGELGSGKLLRQFDPTDGYPDGVIVDRTGSLWSAMWDGSCLIETLPSGRQGRRQSLPVSRPTALASVGPMLFVTSALGAETSGGHDGELLAIALENNETHLAT